VNVAFLDAKANIVPKDIATHIIISGEDRDVPNMKILNPLYAILVVVSLDVQVSIMPKAFVGFTIFFGLILEDPQIGLLLPNSRSMRDFL